MTDRAAHRMAVAQHGEDYALFHPAGALGRKLLRVSEVMRKAKTE